MNEDLAGIKDYRPDYEQLELDDRADWPTARTNYRRLVHLWHPDKFANLPREKGHAQQQFILITKAYDSLKSFHRKNGRLPFEPVRQQSQSERIGQKTRKSSPSRSRKKARRGADDDFHSSILARDSDQTPQTDTDLSSSNSWWITAVVCIVLGTVTAFMVLDVRESQKIIETGKEVLKSTPPSEFMPSSAEIRKSESRGAFVRPTQ